MLVPILLALCAVVLALCAQDVWRELRAPRLEAAPRDVEAVPLVSIVVPARNEAARIGPLLAGLAAQAGAPAFEVVVVDDHSTDGTADVVHGWDRHLPSLRVLPSRELPAGWAGKCWACAQGAEAARGEWLLFLDADVAPGRDLLRALAHRAQVARLDVLSVMPRLVLGGLSERLVLPAFMSVLYALYPLHRVSDPRSRRAFANGQVMLVRRSAYDALGGHAAVKDSILEDTHFGQLARTAGQRLEVAMAPALCDIRMYTDWATVAEGLGKNAVAGARSGGLRSAWVGLRQALVAFGPPLLLVATWLAGAAWAGVLTALLATASWVWIARRRFGAWAPAAALLPVGLAVYYGLSARALWRVRSGTGVTWKGRVVGR